LNFNNSLDSKIENIDTYSNRSTHRPKWGEQWDDEVLEYMTKKGPLTLFEKMLKERADEPCIILGFSYEQKLVDSYYQKIIGVNITKDEFQYKKESNVDYELIVCDAENLPFRDSSFRNVISRAFLHHVDPVKEIHEIKRILSNNGFLFLLEPGKFNPLIAIGRKFFPTNVHVESEHPFNPKTLREIITKNFGEIKYEGYYHIIGAALPFIAKYCKLFKSKKIVDIVDSVDRFLGRGFLKNFAWVLVMGAEKN